MSASLPLIAQATICVDTEALDSVHLTGLQQYSFAINLNAIHGVATDVHTGDFLAYCLFHRQDPGRPNYDTFAKCFSQQNQAATWLDGCIEFNGYSISTSPPGVDPPIDVKERYGEAIGLCIADRLYGLHGADWQKIPIQRGRNAQKTNDWKIAAGSTGFAELETKGSYNQGLFDAPSGHVNSIAAKKNVYRNSQLPATELLGTIAVLGDDPTIPIKCWLLDPPTFGVDEDPGKYQLLARLRFIRDWYAFISPRSIFASVLSDRIGVLEALRDISVLDNVPLRGSSGEILDVSPYEGVSQSRLFGSRSRIAGRNAGGMVLHWSGSHLMFSGIEGDLARLAVEQNHAAIRKFSYAPLAEKMSIHCTLSDKRFKKLSEEGQVEKAERDSQGYWHFTRQTTCFRSSSGVYIGWVPLKSQ